MTQAIDGLKPLVIPDSQDLIIGAQPSDAMMHLLNDINTRIKLIADYQAPVIPDPPDPPVWTHVTGSPFTVSGDITVTGLAGYQSLLIDVANVNLSSSGRVALRVSSDEATYNSASGDYFNALGSGGKTDLTEIALNTSDATTAVYGWALINAFSLTSQKPVSQAFGTNFKIATTSVLKAIKIFGTAGALSSGTISVLGLPGLS